MHVPFNWVIYFSVFFCKTAGINLTKHYNYCKCDTGCTPKTTTKTHSIKRRREEHNETRSANIQMHSKPVFSTQIITWTHNKARKIQNTINTFVRHSTTPWKQPLQQSAHLNIHYSQILQYILDSGGGVGDSKYSTQTHTQMWILDLVGVKDWGSYVPFNWIIRIKELYFFCLFCFVRLLEWIWSFFFL